MYADVNGNRTFDAWDAPLLLPVSVSGPIYPFSHTDATGTYRISGLPGGEYTVDVPVPVPAACTIARPYTWAGDPGRGGGCFTAPRLESRPQLAIVAAGQTATIDFIGVPFTTVSGWIWSDGSAASPLRQVAIAVGSKPCWTATLNHHTSPGNIPATYFEADIDSFTDPECASGDIAVAVDGRPSSFTMTWQNFWQLRLHRENVTGDGNPFEESMIPLFTGYWGKIHRTTPADAIAGSVLSDPVPEGTLVRSFVGEVNCGEVRTKTLSWEYGSFGNLFGLIVPTGETKAACPALGAAPGFCVGSLKASGLVRLPPDQPAKAGMVVEVDLAPLPERCPLGPAGLPDTGGRP